MIRTLALIPARAGSKGIPGKNRRLFHGRPLVSWAIDIGIETCDKAYVSTDDPGVALIGLQAGAGLITRPESLARDETSMAAVVQHALIELDHLRPHIVVLLQPTSPLRTVEHVQKALRLLETKEADSVVSVVRVPAHHSPDYVGRIKEDRIVFPSTTRRQDVRPVYYRDGTVYVVRAEFAREGSLYGHKCIPMILPEHESAIIDTEEDWQRAEALMKVTA